MSEEAKGQQDKKKSDLAPILFKVAAGLGLLVLGGILVISWRQDFLVLIRGAAGLFLIMLGIIILAIARE